AATFAGYAFRPVTAPLGAAVLAFATGIGAYGWGGVFFVISAELGGVRRAGLLSGVAFASIVVGLLIGPAVFGLLLDHWDSYAVPWVIFATLATLVTAATLLAGPAIDRARRWARWRRASPSAYAVRSRCISRIASSAARRSSAVARCLRIVFFVSPDSSCSTASWTA